MEPETEREPSQTPETEPSADNDVVELPDAIAEAIQAVEPKAKPASSRRAAKKAADEGQEPAEPEAPSNEEPPEEGDASDDELPEDHPSVKRAREAQAAADRRAAEAEARAQRIADRLEAIERERRESQIEANEAEFERLLESDDPEDQEKALSLIRDSRRNTKVERTLRDRHYTERDSSQLTFAYQYRDALFPDLTQDDLNTAIEQAIALAAEQKRAPLPAETFALIAQARVAKAVATKDTEIKGLTTERDQLKERVAALEAELTGEVLDEEEGPEEPATSAPEAPNALDQLERASISDLRANPEKYKKTLSRAARAVVRT